MVPGHGWPKNELVRQSVSHTLSQVIGSTEIFRRSIFYIFLEENMDKAMGFSIQSLDFIVSGCSFPPPSTVSQILFQRVVGLPTIYWSSHTSLVGFLTKVFIPNLVDIHPCLKSNIV